MSSLNRRRFIGQSSLATLAPFPKFFSRPLLASDTAKDGRILVVIQLSGGNDGLNTVVPFADDIYAKNRRELRIKADKVIK
ncbi:MAG TPA: Twin-arginine translocation pathway signal sequence domain protein, partial [Pirellula sp.]|nr:Twin-arginine translocation pathway signal sequence domain protein [Pirellula sp.]